MFLEILSFITLLIPTLYEAWNSRRGDKHPNHDLIRVGLLSLIVSGIVIIFNHRVNFVQVIVLSLADFALFFPYLVNVLQMKFIPNHKIKWYDHLSKTAIPDKWEQWNQLNWIIRLLMVLIIFSGAIKLYLCWGKFLSYGYDC